MCSTPEPLARLAEALDGLAALEPTHVTGEQIEQLARQVERARAQLVRHVGSFDAAGGYELDGARSMAAWCRGRLAWSPGQSASTVVAAGVLRRHLPSVAEAFAAGQVGFEQVRVLAHAVNATAQRQASAAEAEALLLDAALRLTPAQLQHVVSRWASLVDAEAYRADELARRDVRRLHASTSLRGMLVIDGLLEGDAAATVQLALEQAGSAIRTPQDPRTPAQLRADALAHVCGQWLGSADARAHRGAVPRVTVHVTWADLVARAGTCGTLERFGPLGAWDALRLLCDATLVPLLTGPDGQVLDQGRARRLPTPAQRVALERRDRRCRFAGCDAPAAWCHAHHLQPWAQGGPTDMDNLVLVCSKHHHDLHDRGYRLVLHADGSSATRRPDGTSIPETRNHHPPPGT